MTPRFTPKVFAAVARLCQPAFRMPTEPGLKVYSTSLPSICATGVRPGKKPAGVATIPSSPPYNADQVRKERQLYGGGVR